MNKVHLRKEYLLWNPDPSISKEKHRLLGDVKVCNSGAYYTPFSPVAMSYLKSLGYDISPVAGKTVENLPGGTLAPYQRDGVSFLERLDGNAILADDPGLGKTVQVLAWLEYRVDVRPALIIVPAYLKWQWQGEINKWMSKKCSSFICSGQSPSAFDAHLLAGSDITLINYNIVYDWKHILEKIPYRVMCLDEAHYIKNDESTRTQIIMELSNDIPRNMGLTGTPITNRPIEYFNLIKLVRPSLFPSKTLYEQRYCDVKAEHGQVSNKGASNTLDLHKKLSETIVLRRKKRDVLKDLPPIIPSLVPFECTGIKGYLKEEMAILNETSRVPSSCRRKALFENTEMRNRIEKLKQLAVKLKYKDCIKWISDFLSETDEKLIVAVVHRSLGADLNAFYKNSVKVDGDTTKAQRDRYLHKFKTDPDCRLLIGNIGSIGTGLDGLQYVCSNMFVIELPWTPGELDQLQSRLDRRGQTNSTNIYFGLLKNSIEEYIANLLQKKIKILAQVLDGKEVVDDVPVSAMLYEYAQYKGIAA